MSFEFSDGEIPTLKVFAHCILVEGEGRVLIDADLFAQLDWHEQDQCLGQWALCLEALMEDLALRRSFDDAQQVDMRPTPALSLVEDDEPPSVV